MISAVLDTNVLASGFAGVLRSTSTPGELIRRWQAGQFSLIISEHIHSELSNTFEDAYFRRRLSYEERASALLALRQEALTAPITITIRGAATHPEDDLILATAVSAQVDYLVTGDRQLQDLGTYEGVTILSPRRFLEILATD